jgi:hypothetical protein
VTTGEAVDPGRVPALARRLDEALATLAGDLDRLGLPWALVGGAAVGLITGQARPCPDIDLAIAAPTREERADLVAQLVRRGHRALVTGAGKAGRAITVLPCTGNRAPGTLVDLLPEACGFEAELCRQAATVALPGACLRVARTGHLLACKLKVMADLDRPKDAADLAALLGAASPGDLALARRALRSAAASTPAAKQALQLAEGWLGSLEHPPGDRLRAG